MTCDGGVLLKALNHRRLIAVCGAERLPGPAPWQVFYEDGLLRAADVPELVALHARACPGPGS